MESRNPQQTLRGRWLFTEHAQHTVAQHLEDRSEVRLDGELHADVKKGGPLLRSLSSYNPIFTDLARVLKEDGVSPSLDLLLRGSGWRLLFLELTGRCNENCLHCYASSSPSVTAALEREEIGNVLSQAKAVGFSRIQLTGGDPLISPHIEFAVEQASLLGFEEIEVYTNALAFNEKLADLFVSRGVSMAVSVYSHDPEIHDSVTRTPNSHERTSRAIRLARKKGIEIRVGGVQGVAAGQDETALRKYVLSLGVPEDRITVDRQRPVGRGQWEDDTQLLNAKNAGHSTDQDLDRGRLCVTYDGDVVPCIFDRATVLGNIRHAGLEEILQEQRPQSSGKNCLPTAGEPLSCIQCQFRRKLLQASARGA